MQSESINSGSQMQLDLGTSEKSEDRTFRKVTGLPAEGFPVRIFLSLARELEWQVKEADCGLNMHGSLARYDHAVLYKTGAQDRGFEGNETEIYLSFKSQWKIF